MIHFFTHFSLFTNGVFLAILAQVLIGISLVWDKILLRQPTTNSIINYVFWLGAISIFGLCLIPFGFNMPPLWLAGLAFAAGIIHLIANYFYYAALKAGDASQTLAIMGGFSPLATALIAIGLLDKPLGGGNELGFALMVGGGFLMFFSEPVDLKKLLPLVLLASLFFGLTNVTQKMAFNATNFVSAYVFFTLGTVAGALFFLVKTSWRQEIFRQSEEASPKSKLWYFINRFMAGVGSFLIFLAIDHANPAIVDGISGVRYVIIFVGAYLLTRYWPRLLKEDFGRWALTAKAIATLLVAAGLVLVAMQGGSTGAA